MNLRNSPCDELYGHLARQTGLAVRVGGAPQTRGDALVGWASSGLACLAGESNSPPVIPRRDYARRLESVLQVTKAFAALSGREVALDRRIFAERAAELGLHRGGRLSCNGTARLLRTENGWIAVNLARQEDVDAVPAWLARETGHDVWAAIEHVATSRVGSDFAAAGQLLGIPAAVVDAQDDEQWRARWNEGPRAARIVRMSPPIELRPGGWANPRPVVIDLSSLWAGPLCGHVLTLAGARVIKVESVGRPDAARFGPRRFFERLHWGQEWIAVDIATAQGRSRLANLISSADVIIESSRPRAIEQLGIDVGATFRANPRQIWVSVTAYGRTGPWSNRVGFGDDTAASGGLVAHDGAGDPVFFGDAIADPIAGLIAGAAALAALCAGGGLLIDVALREAAAFVADGDLIAGHHSARVEGEEGRWRLRSGTIDTPLQPPRARRPSRPRARSPSVAERCTTLAGPR